jgi:phage baseplate assembly protein W
MARPAPNRAFRFVHPDLDLPDALPDPSGANPEAYSGLRLGPRGGPDMVSGDDSVRQAVLLLLSTRPGERVMRPNYGCYLNQLVFAPNDDTTAAIAIHHVRRALLQWEPRIDILSLDAHRDPDDATTLLIILKYQVRTTHQVEELQLALDLAGGES